MPTYADLERRYDGAIPEHLLKAAHHGSALAARIADVETTIRFFRSEIVEFTASAHRWRARGAEDRVAENVAYLRDCLADWRAARKELAWFKGEKAQRANATNFFNILDQV